MQTQQDVQLSRLVDTARPEAVIQEVTRIFASLYPARHFSPVKRSFGIIKKLFNGKFPGYLSCTTEYHDFTHTTDALLAAARLAEGGFDTHPLSQKLFVNLLLAALFHDTGYIQEAWDREGTGAKYTSNHVERSIVFLQKNASVFSLDDDDTAIITRLIRCTGLNVDLDTIEFFSGDERYAGCMLGTADILGQMADRAYLEKLIFLYKEFKEAGIPGFNTEFDILRKTIDFYEITLQRLKGPYGGVYQNALMHFNRRFGINANLYMDAIERHIEYLRKIIEDDTTNFRHKLKRGSWIHEAQSVNNH